MRKLCIAAILAGNLLLPMARADDAPATVSASVADIASQVEIESPEYLKGLKRVAITSFSVEIMTQLKAGGDGDLGNLISGKPNSVSVTIKGYDKASWQPVVDAYYRKLLTQLAQAGIEVVPMEKLREQPEFKSIENSAKPTPHEEDAKAGLGYYFGTAEVPMLIQNEQNVFRKGLFHKPPEDLYMTFGTRFAAGFATAGVEQAEYALAKKLDAHILKVRFTLLPTALSETKGFWVGRTVDSKASLSLPTHVNRFVLYSPNGDHTKISLKAPVVGSKTVGDMVETTSTAGSALRTANAVGGIALGLLTRGVAGAISAGANVEKNYEVSIDNAAFNAMLAEELGNVSEAFVKQLKPAS